MSFLDDADDLIASLTSTLSTASNNNNFARQTSATSQNQNQNQQQNQQSQNQQSQNQQQQQQQQQQQPARQISSQSSFLNALRHHRSSSVKPEVAFNDQDEMFANNKNNNATTTSSSSAKPPKAKPGDRIRNRSGTRQDEESQNQQQKPITPVSATSAAGGGGGGGGKFAPKPPKYWTCAVCTFSENSRQQQNNAEKCNVCGNLKGTRMCSNSDCNTLSIPPSSSSSSSSSFVAETTCSKCSAQLPALPENHHNAPPSVMERRVSDNNNIINNNSEKNDDNVDEDEDGEQLHLLMNDNNNNNNQQRTSDHSIKSEEADHVEGENWDDEESDTDEDDFSDDENNNNNNNNDNDSDSDDSSDSSSSDDDADENDRRRRNLVQNLIDDEADDEQEQQRMRHHNRNRRAGGRGGRQQQQHHHQEETREEKVTREALRVLMTDLSDQCAHEDIPAAQPPASMRQKGNLKVFQLVALNWMLGREQGMGKTKEYYQQQQQQQLLLLQNNNNRNNNNAYDENNLLVLPGHHHQQQQNQQNQYQQNHHQQQQQQQRADNDNVALRFKGGMLGDFMGFGKTRTMISLCETTRNLARQTNGNIVMGGKLASAATLIICPVSVMNSWLQEIRNVVTGSRKILRYHGHGRHKNIGSVFQLAQNYDYILTTYHTVAFDLKQAEQKRREHQEQQQRLMMLRGGEGEGGEDDNLINLNNNMHRGIDLNSSPLLNVEWFRVVLDEAHIIRNTKSSLSQACCSLRATRRWAITATPFQNRVDDLYALFKFLQVPCFSNRTFFTDHVLTPLQRAIQRSANTIEVVLHGRGEAAAAAGNNQQQQREQEAEQQQQQRRRKAAEAAQTALAKARALAPLNAVMSGLMMRRTFETRDKETGELLLVLPPRTNHVVAVEFEESERKIYEALYKDGAARVAELQRYDPVSGSSGGILSKQEMRRLQFATAFEMLMRCRQACCHTYLMVRGMQIKARQAQLAAGLQPTVAEWDEEIDPNNNNNNNQQQQQQQEEEQVVKPEIMTMEEAARIAAEEMQKKTEQFVQNLRDRLARVHAAAQKRLNRRLLVPNNNNNQNQNQGAGGGGGRGSALPEFVKTQLEEFATAGGRVEGDCIICLDPPCDPSMLQVCAHIFCHECITRAVTEYKRCPTCKTAAKVDDIIKMTVDQEGEEGSKKKEDEDAIQENPVLKIRIGPMPRWPDSIKTKTLLKMMNEFPEEETHVLVFSQFLQYLHFLVDRCKSRGHETYLYCGAQTANKRAQILSDYQKDLVLTPQEEQRRRQEQQQQQQNQQEQRNIIDLQDTPQHQQQQQQQQQNQRVKREVVDLETPPPAPRLQQEENQQQQQQQQQEREEGTFRKKKILFATIQTCGIGVNITKATRCILLDPAWNLPMEEQAISRCHRIGQNRPVNIYRFNISNTVEDRIIGLGKQKAEYAGLCLEGSGNDPRADANQNNNNNNNAGARQRAGIGLQEIMDMFRLPAPPAAAGADAAAAAAEAAGGGGEQERPRENQNQNQARD